MIASEMISNVVPVLKRTDTCMQALNWMELFRVSHLPVVEDGRYIGLLSDEAIYSHGESNEPIVCLEIQTEGTFVYEDYHIYDVIGLASRGLLSVVAVLRRNRSFMGSIELTAILHKMDKLLCVDTPGGIIVLEVNGINYSLAEVAQIVEYNEAKVLSCYVSDHPGSRKMHVTIKVNTLNIEPLLDTFLRYNYVIKNSFVTGDDSGDLYQERYDQLMKYLSV